MSEHTNDRLGRKISNYQLIRLIGHGGFADVYLGEHIYLKTQAAVKILHARTDDADQPDILNEARAIAQLEHPHIIRLYEYGIDDGYPFLIMSYAARGSVRNYYPKGSRLPVALVVRYAQQIASALDYAHGNRLIHRDVKPENMLIGQHDQLLLTDFGLVMMAQTSRSQASDDLAGTVAYMAPEQLRGRPRFASDQYALGVVVYEWLCGKRPFNGSFAEVASQQVLESPPSLCALEPSLAPEVEQVVLKALAKDYAQRFESAGEFAHALAQAYGSASQLTLSPAPVSLLNSEPSKISSPNTSNNQPAATLSPLRHDVAKTVEIPIEEAITTLYDGEATLDMLHALAGTRAGKQLSITEETTTPDTAQQTLQLSPVIGATRTVPVRHARILQRIPILIALILLIGGSAILGFNKLVGAPGSTIGTDAENTFPPTLTATDAGTNTVTAIGTIRSTSTPAVNTPAPDPVATKPAQKVVPVIIPTSVPPTRDVAPTPEPPTPAPEQPTPIPTSIPTLPPMPTIDPSATPDLNATPPP